MSDTTILPPPPSANVDKTECQRSQVFVHYKPPAFSEAELKRSLWRRLFDTVASHFRRDA